LHLLLRGLSVGILEVTSRLLDSLQWLPGHFCLLWLLTVNQFITLSRVEDEASTFRSVYQSRANALR